MKLSIIIFVIFLPIGISLFNNVNKKLKKRASTRATKDNFIVYIPEIAAVVGLADVIVFGLVIIFAPVIWSEDNFKSLTIFYFCFGGFVFLGTYLVSKTLRFRVAVQKENITVYPLLAKSYRIKFTDISSVNRQTKKRYEGHAERLVVRAKQGNRFIVDSSFVNYKKMVEKIIENVEPSKLQGVWEE